MKLKPVHSQNYATVESMKHMQYIKRRLMYVTWLRRLESVQGQGYHGSILWLRGSAQGQTTKAKVTDDLGKTW